MQTSLPGWETNLILDWFQILMVYEYTRFRIRFSSWRQRKIHTARRVVSTPDCCPTWVPPCPGPGGGTLPGNSLTGNPPSRVPPCGIFPPQQFSPPSWTWLRTLPPPRYTALKKHSGYTVAQHYGIGLPPLWCLPQMAYWVMLQNIFGRWVHILPVDRQMDGWTDVVSKHYHPVRTMYAGGNNLLVSQVLAITRMSTNRHK